MLQCTNFYPISFFEVYVYVLYVYDIVRSLWCVMMDLRARKHLCILRVKRIGKFKVESILV